MSDSHSTSPRGAGTPGDAVRVDDRGAPDDGAREETRPHGPGGAPSYSPWRQSFPPGDGHELDRLLLRLELYEELALLHRFDADGRVATIVAHPDDIAHATARGVQLKTPILPPNALWAVLDARGYRVAVWRPPQLWRVRLKEKWESPVREFTLPMPGLVFIHLPGGQAPYVYAARARPKGDDDVLYKMPSYNVFESGRICVGSHQFPADPDKLPEEFFTSYFSPDASIVGRSQRYPESILRLWESLDGQKKYPLDDLVAQFTVADAKSAGTIW
jgi:hypothetical protein